MSIKLAEIRRLVAILIDARGCGCCGDHKDWSAAVDSLGALLRVPRYKDGSGRDFNSFRKVKKPSRPTTKKTTSRD